MKRRMGNCIVRGTICVAMTSMVVANSKMAVYAEDVVPAENIELSDDKETMVSEEVSKEKEYSKEEVSEVASSSEKEENSVMQSEYTVAVAEVEMKNEQMVMTVQDVTDVERAEEEAQKAKEQADSIEQEIERIEDAHIVVSEEKEKMKDISSEVEEEMEKLSQMKETLGGIQEGVSEEIEQEAEVVEKLIEDIEGSIDEEGNLIVEVEDEEGETKNIELEGYLKEQEEAVKQIAEQAHDLLVDALNLDKTASEDELDTIIQQVQEVAEQAKNISQKAQDVYNSAESVLKEEIKKYNAYVSLYGEAYELEPMMYEDEILTYTDAELEQAGLVISTLEDADEYRETLAEISTITEKIENAEETVKEAEQACINANEEANQAMDAVYQAKQQTIKHADQAVECAEKVEETGSVEEKEQAKAAKEQANVAKKQANDSFASTIPMLNSMNNELSLAHQTCEGAKKTIQGAEVAVNAVLPMLEYNADIVGMYDVLSKKLDLWNEMKINMTSSLKRLGQQNTRVENYTEWTVGLRDSVDVRLYGQRETEGSNIITNKNLYKYDLTNEEVKSRPQNLFIEVTPKDGSVKVPKNIYRAFALEMHDKDAIWTDGKGISLDSVMPMVYWEWDEATQKLTGNYYLAEEDGGVPVELQGKTYFVGYALKTEADGYHIDGYLERSEVVEVEPMPQPSPMPQLSPMPQSIPLQVVIEEEETPLAALVPGQEIDLITGVSSPVEESETTVIEEEGVPLMDAVPTTGDNSLPSMPFAVGGFGAMAAAIAINWSKKRRID